jgi:2-polyprenyl-6-methoxyphenol hydroxylase-like FAD-dependent oxidoreductase
MLAELIRERAPWFGGSIGRLDWAMVVQFDRRLAREFGRDRIWLAGDAAHMTWPAGMQSMNLGLREAHELAEKIPYVLEGSDPEGVLLLAYGRERRAEWEALLGLRGELRPEAGTDPWITANAARILPCLPASGIALRLLLRQLQLAVEAPSLVAG